MYPLPLFSNMFYHCATPSTSSNHAALVKGGEGGAHSLVWTAPLLPPAEVGVYPRDEVR